MSLELADAQTRDCTLAELRLAVACALAPMDRPCVANLKFEIADLKLI